MPGLNGGGAAAAVPPMGDGFYRSKDPTNSIKVVKEKAIEKLENANNKIHIYIHI